MSPRSCRWAAGTGFDSTLCPMPNGSSCARPDATTVADGRRAVADPLLDQVQAANAEAHRNITTALGLPDVPATAGTSTLFEELWQRFATAPRCTHLQRRPVQPSHLVAWSGVWRCSPCLREFTDATRGTLDPIEEFTCDRCRRYAPSSIEPAVIRQDFWVVVAGLCGPCSDALIAGGGRRVQTHG
jgi:hypothetical protein